MVINKDKFDSLSPEVQQILLDAGKEVAIMDVKMVQDSEADQLKELEAAGMIVTYPDQDEFREVLEPLYESYASQYGSEWAELIDLMKKVTE